VGETIGGSRTDRLLEFWRPYRPRRLTRRERRVEGLAALAFVALAVALPLLAPSERPFELGPALALALAYAFASRVRLYLGSGFAMPNQFVLVPMLYLLPPSSVPAVVACALAVTAILDSLAGRARPERILSAVADAWPVAGGAVVFVVAGAPDAGLDSWDVLVLALAAECAVDLLAAFLREWVGRGIAPTDLVRVILSVYRIDACLAPIGLAVAIAARQHPFAFLLGLPLLALLAGLAIERRTRIEEAVARGDELAESYARLDRTIRRIGESFASNLDRTALLNLVLHTAGEALEAEHGRARFGSGTAQWTADPSDPAPEIALDAAERAAARAAGLRTTRDGPYAAMSHPVGTDMLTLARRDRPFSEGEQSLFTYLAQQATIAIENVELHDLLQRQATVDELTGLANHRRFRDALEFEFTRMRRTRRPLALVLFDIDDFKTVNDTYGHPQGDQVLCSVATVLKDACRETDVPARHGGEELALILPETDLEGGFTIAETVRRAIEALAIPRPGAPPLRITVSAGVSALEQSTADPAALIGASDVALYAAKRAGKNQTRRGRAGRRA
jgi:diguanylate cyclase (GGDEF)-like protein